jgi:DsbC/DsbD-like thiol-disulfide interchange protein
MTDMGSMKLRLPLVFLFACIAAQPAFAASSAWHETTGGRVRLVTAGPVDAKGVLRGALQIELQPGWKTYWRDPGNSGVPPQIDIGANGEWSKADIEFPAPQWHRDDYGMWAGYDHSVALPVKLETLPGKTPASVSGSVFLGICETICVPLQAPLALDVDAAATPAEDSAIVDAAWDSLPKPADDAFRVSGISPGKDSELEVSVTAPIQPVELFLAGQDGYMFGTPKPLGDGRFSLKVISRPKLKPAGPGLHYTLVTPQGAVSGLIDYP